MAVFIVSLFDAISNRHITLSDYLQTHKPEEFKALTKQAPSFIDILIAWLPENFIHALSTSRKNSSANFKLDAVTVKHYTDAIRKSQDDAKGRRVNAGGVERSRAASKVDDANSSVEEEADRKSWLQQQIWLRSKIAKEAH